MDKEKSEVIQRLFEASRQSFDERRKYQWKVNLAFWAAAAIASWTLGQLRFSGTISCLAIALVWIVAIPSLAIIYTVWSHGIWYANAWDKTRADHYRNCLQQIVGYADPIPVTPKSHERRWWWKDSEFWKDWSHRTEIIFTLFFLIMLGFLLTLRWKEPKSPEQVPTAKQTAAALLSAVKHIFV